MAPNPQPLLEEQASNSILMILNKEKEEEETGNKIAQIKMRVKLFGKGEKSLGQMKKLRVAHRQMMLESLQGLEALRQMKELEKNIKIDVLMKEFEEN